MFVLVLAIAGGLLVAALHTHAALARRNDGIPTVPLYMNIPSLLRGETRNDFYEVRIHWATLWWKMWDISRKR